MLRRVAGYVTGIARATLRLDDERAASSTTISGAGAVRSESSFITATATRLGLRRGTRV